MISAQVLARRLLLSARQQCAPAAPTSNYFTSSLLSASFRFGSGSFRWFYLVIRWLFFEDFHPFVQCMRKWWDTRHCSGWENTGNLVNAGKYFSCIFLVLADVLKKWSPSATTGGFWIASAIIKTMFVYFLIAFWSACGFWKNFDMFFLHGFPFIWLISNPH